MLVVALPSLPGFVSLIFLLIRLFIASEAEEGLWFL